MNRDTAMTLFNFGGLPDPVTEDLGKVFGSKITQDKFGQSIVRTTMLKKRDVAENLKLKGKDNAEALSDAILKRSDIAFRELLGNLAKSGDLLTYVAHTTRRDKNGKLMVTIRLKEAVRAKVISPEMIARAWKISLEEAKALVAKYNVVSPVHDVESSAVSPAALPAPTTPEAAPAPAVDNAPADTSAAEAQSETTPPLTQEEIDAIEFARLEQEEANKEAAAAAAQS